MVPAEFIRYTCGRDDYESYLRSGFEVASMLNLALKKTFGRVVADYGNVLDFGCGSGRLSRFMNPPHLFGCDVNGPVVEYCKRTIPSGRFDQNGLLPPLPDVDESFGEPPACTSGRCTRVMAACWTFLTTARRRTTRLAGYTPTGTAIRHRRRDQRP